MADQNDLTLTFTPDMFMNAVSEMGKSLASLELKMGSVAQSTSKMEKKGAMAIGIWTAVATKALGFISSAVSKMLSYIPEIGRAFTIAGDIIGRNLFWPLRQQLIPLLQSFLNWVRDNRAMFVRWGQVIANVFRALIGVVKQFWGLFKRIWEQVGNSLKKIFGSTLKSISELINIALFRMAVVMTTFIAIIEPPLRFIVDIIMQVVKAINQFFTGFSEGIGDILAPIKDIIDAFSAISDALGLSNAAVEDSISSWKAFGSILGSVVRTALEIVAMAIRGIADEIGDIVDKIELVRDIAKGISIGEATKVYGSKREKRLSEQAKFENKIIGRTKESWEKTINTVREYHEQAAKPLRPVQENKEQTAKPLRPVQENKEQAAKPLRPVQEYSEKTILVKPAEAHIKNIQNKETNSSSIGAVNIKIENHGVKDANQMTGMWWDTMTKTIVDNFKNQIDRQGARQ